MERREQAEKYIRKRFREIIFKRNYIEDYVNYIVKKYNQDITVIMDYINDRISMSNSEDFDIYTLLDGLDKKDKTNYCKEYFRDDEIKEYSKAKYKQEAFKFPIVISCVPVTSDQWVGATSAQFYMKLRKAQLIRYNVEAQRVMRPLKNRKDGIETWQIAVNKTSVKEIANQMREGTYIPDELTLNIPDDAECDMEYINGELIINKIDHFDISDGYHRYLAMAELFDEDNCFDFPMEIRIINYSLTKVKRFIHQKDQKTKMSKIDSDSMNMDNFANIICEQLNTNYNYSTFILHGKINRNDGAIRLPELAKIIEYFYTPKTKGGYKRYKKVGLKEISQIREELKDGLNRFFIEIYPEDIEVGGHVDYQDLLLGMYIIKYDLFSQYDKATLQDKFDYASEEMHSNEFKKYFVVHTPKARQINLIKELLS